MFQSRFASILILAAAAGTLGACASSPRYVAADNVDDVGHYSTRLGEQRYRVVYNGDRSTGLNTTRNYALLRAAQLTLREGYDWFEVTDRDTATLEQSRPTTEWSVEHAWYVERDCGLLGCTQSATPYTTTRVDTGSTARRERYSQMLEIVMGKGPMPTGGGDYYDADTVEKSLVESMLVMRTRRPVHGGWKRPPCTLVSAAARRQIFENPLYSPGGRARRNLRRRRG